MCRNLYLIIAVLGLAACGHKDEAGSVMALAPAPAMVSESRMLNKMSDAATDGLAKAKSIVAERHIELRHNVTLEVPANELEGVWRERLEACSLPGCEVISASIDNARGEMASAHLSLRIVPAQAGGLLDTLRARGKLAQHQMSQADRSNEVIDIQARLTNQKALRDRLRALVASHNVAKISDLLAVEQELARVQGEIDSAEGQMRATLAMTEKVSFDISFRAPASFSQPGSWEPLRRAWSKMGSTFAESLAALMYFVAGGLPWFVLGAGGFWGLRCVWHRRKAGRPVKAD